MSFPSENILFTKDVGTQDQVLWLKLMMLGIKVTEVNWVQILPIGAFYNFYTSVFSGIIRYGIKECATRVVY